MPDASIMKESNFIELVQSVLASSAAALRAMQRSDGHWIFDLEADVTIPAEFILYLHFLDERDHRLEKKIAVYLREKQADHGGWALFHGGDFDMSASVKAYFALKAAGDQIDAAHMVKAREAILSHGGAARSNVFTRNLLALWGIIPWRAVPVMPVEIMLLPQWFFFHLSKVSYWSRTVIVPLLVLNALKVQSRNPENISLDELFPVSPDRVRNWNHEPVRSPWAYLFRGLDRLLWLTKDIFPQKLRLRAIEKARIFVDERINGEDGLGAIFPAMVNSVLMYEALGVPIDDRRLVTAKEAVRKLVVDEGDKAWVQPCLSPVWDTSLVIHALLEVGDIESVEASRRGAEWLIPRQIRDVDGDWLVRRPALQAGGGWAFQYANPHYPDVDDTAVVLAALDRLDADFYREVVDLGIEWLAGMQSSDGGWGAFEPENIHYTLNHIPFADHGALLDPPTADVSARCISALAKTKRTSQQSIVLQRAMFYLLEEQEEDGSWYGRWGTNYIYGTWSALCALNAAGIKHEHSSMRRAVTWLFSKQREDGGWGEDGRSYWEDQPRGEARESTPSHTAWALLGLMAAGEGKCEQVKRGIAWLLNNRNENGLWDEKLYNAVGFPRIFYLSYHGYRTYFPVWALARYCRLVKSEFSAVPHAL